MEPPRTRGHQTGPAVGRWAEIVALREAGWLYPAIASRIGITRERVRQILHKAGRSDLCGYFPVNLVTRPCSICGKEFPCQPSQPRHLCGRQRCRKASMRLKRGKAADQRVERMIDLRERETSWQDIARIFYPEAGTWGCRRVFADLKRYERRHGCDLSHLKFNLHSVRARRRQRAEYRS